MGRKIPNILTVIRIFLIPIILYLIYVNTDYSRWLAFWIYFVSGITDFLDGYIARKNNYLSELGRFLDPVADKLLVIMVIVMLMFVKELDGWLVLVSFAILIRELVVTGLREYLAEIQIKVPVSKIAKIKTFSQMISLGFIIIGSNNIGHFEIFYNSVLILYVFSAVVTIISGYQYVVYGMKHMLNDNR